MCNTYRYRINLRPAAIALIAAASLGLSATGWSAPKPKTKDQFPLIGRSAQIDTAFPYYKDRSPESIASELRVNRYRVVHDVVTNENAIDPALIAALHHEKIGVWYVTFGNGAYNTDPLPPGWEKWSMALRGDFAGTPVHDGFNRLCLNNPEYRKWKKKQISETLRRIPFDGVEIVESHWPEYPGRFTASYGCFCESCHTAFQAMYPDETRFPDIIHSASAQSPERNPVLWRKWLKFREASVAGYLNDLVNGPDGVRKTVPSAKVSVWALTLTGPDALKRMREDCGEDAADIAKTVHPDLLGLQTNWPDWSRAELKPSYADQLMPFVSAVRSVAPTMPLLIQADTGSTRANLRSRSWIKAFEKECSKIGVGSTTYYSYEASGLMYEAPRIAEATRTGRNIEVVFNKRVDPATSDPKHYTLDRGKVTATAIDGNIVKLTTDAEGEKAASVTARSVANMPKLLLFPEHPAAILNRQTIHIDRQAAP